MTILLDGYRILGKIYESPNSIIYRGIWERDDQPIILKVLAKAYPTPAEVARYRQEYEILSNLAIDGTIAAYELLEHESRLILILEDFGGTSLRELINDSVEQKNIASLANFLPLAIQVTETLGNIHAANIIHKDINPANIAIARSSNATKMLDFGIATTFTRENPSLKSPSFIEGTLAYISPEQTGRMNRCLDYRTDIYSLGVTFYELLTGQPPFTTHDALELMHCHMAKQPVPPDRVNPEIPKPIADIVMKAIAKNAEERYQSAFGLKADLERCLHQLTERNEIAPLVIAQQDISDKFQIHQKLYGREAEVATLLAGFERVRGGQGDEGNSESQTPSSELLLVSGYSGIGKSALVREIHKPITRDRGYFVSGKFDQFQRDIPYSAIVTALSSLIKQLLTESEEKIEQFRHKLLENLGVNVRVAIDVIPELALLTGEQPSVTTLGAVEAQNRFNRVFKNLIGTFCDREHPLVIFLDDLQWADSATLNLVQQIVTDVETQHFLLLGAYRDNEVNETHPLTLALEDIRNAGAKVTTIHLAPLKPEDVNLLVADALQSDLSEVKPLSDLVFKKTQGNPFFVNEFLKSLHVQKLLFFDWTSRSWQWNAMQLERTAFTDNVVELTIAKLKAMPPTTQRILSFAAFMGRQIDLQILSLLTGETIAELNDILKGAINAELINVTPESNAKLLSESYEFAHDRIQEAAYALVEDSEKKTVHLHLARLLLQNSSPETQTQNLFEIVDNFNAAGEEIDDPQERDRVAKLNLKAGQKAKASTAYGAAVNYFQAGLNLLEEDSWEEQYELALALYTEAVEANYLNIDFERAEALTEVVLEKAKTILDKFKVYDARMQFFCIKNQMRAAIDTGLKLLEMLGIQLAESPPPDLRVENLAQLPKMIDPASLSAMRILINLFSPAYISNPDLLPKIAFTMLELCVREGNSPQAAFAYAFYGVILGTGRHDIETGYQFGRLALNVFESFNDGALKCKVFEVFNAFIRHWKEPVRASVGALRETIQFGLEVGDLEFAGYTIIHYCSYLLLAGEPLDVVKREQTKYLSLLYQTKQDFGADYLKVWLDLALELTQSFDRGALQKRSQSEETLISEFEKKNNASSLFCTYITKTIISYLFKNYQESVTYAELARAYEPAMAGLLPAMQHPFYSSLALLALYLHTSDERQREYLDIIDLNQTKMKAWADCAPINFQHKYDLVEAEKARILGRHWQAAELYERAIKGAERNKFIQDRALANELAAEFYLASGMDKIALVYLQEALSSYASWQALAKVEDLKTRYPQLNKSSVTVSNVTEVQTTTTPGVALDFATTLRASQAIGSEIRLEQLLQKLMKLLIENAGAQVGYLLLESQGRLFIEAEGSVDSEAVTVLQSIPLDDSPKVSSAIVNYVARTRQILVLDDAANEGDFVSVPEVRERQIKSVMCVPLLERGKLISIAYLENNLQTGVFTPNRVEILKTLSSQAAITIDNARLYQTLEDKVEQRTEELAIANQEIAHLNEYLKQENLRLNAEINVAKKLQEMVLPKPAELAAIEDLEIAAFMEPADEVGGDYYDVLFSEGIVTIAIGDVTGHGLESGILMVMTQTAVRTLQESGEREPVSFLSTLNRTLYKNIERMNSEKNLTLAILNYANGVVSISGQHEEILIVREGGRIEAVDTIDLGFPIGLEEEISEFVNSVTVDLETGDGIVLYTDGITEATNAAQQFYGIERLRTAIATHWHLAAEQIKEEIINDLRQFIKDAKVFDDITLVVIKKEDGLDGQSAAPTAEKPALNRRD